MAIRNAEYVDLYAARGDLLHLVRRSGYVRNILCGGYNPILVIFVGEGNFTFSTAFASLRGSWENIIASECGDVPGYYDTVLRTITACRDNGGNELLQVEVIRAIVNLPMQNFVPHIDATKPMNIWPLIDRRHPCSIFFQCPYAGYKNDETKILVREFITAASSVQEQGDYILIGITKLEPYSWNYGLKYLTDNEGGIRNDGYWFEGADDQFTNDIVLRGYRHEGLRDIRGDLINNFVTLCFTRL